MHVSGVYGAPEVERTPVWRCQLRMDEGGQGSAPTHRQAALQDAASPTAQALPAELLAAQTIFVMSAPCKPLTAQVASLEAAKAAVAARGAGSDGGGAAHSAAAAGDAALLMGRLAAAEAALADAQALREGELADMRAALERAAQDAAAELDAAALDRSRLLCRCAPLGEG